jgi:hypothetical protein
VALYVMAGWLVLVAAAWPLVRRGSSAGRDAERESVAA